MWQDFFEEEIVKEASVQAKRKAEAIKLRRMNGQFMDYSKRNSGGAGDNRSKALLSLENKTTPFVGGNGSVIPYRKSEVVNGFKFNPINNQYRRNLAANQLAKGNAIGSNNIELNKLQYPSAGGVYINNPNFEGYSDTRLSNLETNQLAKGNATGGKNIVLRRPQYPSTVGAYINNPNFGGYSDPRLSSGGNAGFSPWMIGAGTLGLGALGLGAYGLSHLGGDAEDVVLPQQNDISEITNNPYAMGALGVGAAGLGYGLARKK